MSFCVDGLAALRPTDPLAADFVMSSADFGPASVVGSPDGFRSLLELSGNGAGITSAL